MINIHKIILHIFLCLQLLNISFGQQNQYYRLQTTINPYINITKSLSISPVQSKFIIGGSDGTLKIFDLKTGDLISAFNQQNTEIYHTKWQDDRQGIITVSIDATTNKSIAVMRDKHNYQQIYRWVFNEFVYGMDTIYNPNQSYVCFNFGTRIDQYSIRLKQQTFSYNMYRKLANQVAYSSNYTYLHALRNYSQLFVVKVRNPGGQMMSFLNATFLHMEADRYDYDRIPVILKYSEKNETLWIVIAWSQSVAYNFPQDIDMNYYKYCPKDYIIGLSNDQTIYIFSRDYQFTLYATINKFKNQKISILQMQCQNGHLVVTSSNNFIFVYQLTPFSEIDQINWMKVGVLIGSGALVVIILSIVIFKKIKKNRLLKQKANKGQFLNEQVDGSSLLSSNSKN